MGGENMITLHDVIDTRTGRHYSVVMVKANKAKWFIPAPVGVEPDAATEGENNE